MLDGNVIEPLRFVGLPPDKVFMKNSDFGIPIDYSNALCLRGWGVSNAG